jgi:hypothetical protein
VTVSIIASGSAEDPRIATFSDMMAMSHVPLFRTLVPSREEGG